MNTSRTETFSDSVFAIAVTCYAVLIVYYWLPLKGEDEAMRNK